MSKKWIVLLSAFGMLAAARAAVVDDFESYLTGQDNIGLDTGGIWTGIPDFTGNPEIATDGANQWLRSYGVGRGTFRALDQTYASGMVTAEFDIWIDTFVNDTSFGLAQGGSATSWSDFGAYVSIVGGGFRARDGGSNIPLVDVTTNVMYHVQLVADVGAATYDVFLDGGQVATNFAFRTGGATTFDALKMFSNAGDPGNWVNVDNVLVVPEPATIGLVALCGAGIIFVRRRNRI